MLGQARTVLGTACHGGAEMTSPESTRGSEALGTGFVPVMVEAPEPTSAAAPGRMEIVLGGEVRVVVDATVHAPAPARVRVRVLAVVAGR